MAGEPVTKAGALIPDEAPIEVARPSFAFVSRGGVKLAHALEAWPIAVQDRIALDIGASTGGFTDVMLQRGATKVYAVDVGYGQLAWSLRQDSRVVVRERTNARHLTALDLYGAESPASLAVIDVSFISLTKILPAVAALLTPPADVVALIKPQFEAGREQVGKRGVVRDPKVHDQVVERVAGAAREIGFEVREVTLSPIKGPEGNVEFLMWLSLA